MEQLNEALRALKMSCEIEHDNVGRLKIPSGILKGFFPIKCGRSDDLQRLSPLKILTTVAACTNFTE